MCTLSHLSGANPDGQHAIGVTAQLGGGHRPGTTGHETNRHADALVFAEVFFPPDGRCNSLKITNEVGVKGASSRTHWSTSLLEIPQAKLYAINTRATRNLVDL